MKPFVIGLIFVMSVSAVPAVFAETNFCHDPKTWDDWDKIVRQCPLDVPLQILHALRIGLCVKVENGSITFNEATDLMDEKYNMLIQERGEEDRRLKKQQL